MAQAVYTGSNTTTLEAFDFASAMPIPGTQANFPDIRWMIRPYHYGGNETGFQLPDQIDGEIYHDPNACDSGGGDTGGDPIGNPN